MVAAGCVCRARALLAAAEPSRARARVRRGARRWGAASRQPRVGVVPENGVVKFEKYIAATPATFCRGKERRMTEAHRPIEQGAAVGAWWARGRFARSRFVARVLLRVVLAPSRNNAVAPTLAASANEFRR